MRQKILLGSSSRGKDGSKLKESIDRERKQPGKFWGLEVSMEETQWWKKPLWKSKPFKPNQDDRLPKAESMGKKSVGNPAEIEVPGKKLEKRGFNKA